MQDYAFMNLVARKNVVFVYLNEYSYLLCRLSSGGETSLKATFLATTLGLRRPFYFVNRSNSRSITLLFFPLIKLFLIFQKIFKNQEITWKMKRTEFKGIESLFKNAV